MVPKSEFWVLYPNSEDESFLKCPTISKADNQTIIPILHNNLLIFVWHHECFQGETVWKCVLLFPCVPSISLRLDTQNSLREIRDYPISFATIGCECPCLDVLFSLSHCLSLMAEDCSPYNPGAILLSPSRPPKSKYHNN